MSDAAAQWLREYMAQHPDGPWYDGDLTAAFDAGVARGVTLERERTHIVIEAAFARWATQVEQFLGIGAEVEP